MSIPQNHISFDIDHDRTSYEYKLFTLYIFSRLMHRITCTCTYAQAQALVEVAPAPDVATLQLPVAARPLPPGTILSSEDFLLKEFPLDLVPVAAITETISLESQLIVEPIGQGETFSTTKIAGDLLSTANIIEDGDRLDLLLTLQVASADGESAQPVTAFTLQNILVFRVLRPAGEIDARAILALQCKSLFYLVGMR